MEAETVDSVHSLDPVEVSKQEFVVVVVVGAVVRLGSSVGNLSSCGRTYYNRSIVSLSVEALGPS